MDSRLRAPVWKAIIGTLLAVALVYLFASTSDSKDNVAVTWDEFEGPPVELLARSTLEEEHGDWNNLTGRDIGIVKRVYAPASDYNTYNLYRCKGEILEGYMLSDSAGLPPAIRQITDSKTDDLKADYTDTLADNSEINMNTLQVDLHLQDLEGVEGFKPRMRNPVQQWVTYNNPTDAPWFQMDWVQDKRYVPGGQLGRPGQPATNAYYSNIISPNNKIIVIRSARSPGYQTAQTNNGVPRAIGDLPKVQKWSDATFLMLALLSSKNFVLGTGGRPVLAPLWYLIEQIDGPPDSLAVISHCLILYGWNNPNNLPTFGQRVTFPIGSACYRAILGTPNSAGIVWFLVQRKYRFLDTAMGSVTIWGSQTYDPVTGYEQPSLLWWAFRANAAESSGVSNTDLVAVRDANAAFEQGRVPGDMDFPWKMTPVYHEEAS